MIRYLLCTATVLLARSVLAAENSELSAAIAKLASADSYSWTCTATNVTPLDSGPDPIKVEGKNGKDGLVFVSIGESTQDGIMEAYVKNGKGAIHTLEGWQSVSTVAAGERTGLARDMAVWMQGLKTPAAEARELLDKGKNLDVDRFTPEHPMGLHVPSMPSSLFESYEAYTVDLPGDAVKSFLSFLPARNSGVPEIKWAKGSVKFFVVHGSFTGYEVKMEGSTSNNIPVSRNAVIIIRDGGTGKIIVPDEAKEFLH